jgi:hypothetical protein
VKVLWRLSPTRTKGRCIKHLGCDSLGRGEQKSSKSENSMLPVVQIVLILETEKSSLERFDPRVRPASLSTPWYGAGDEGSLLFANFRSCSVQRRHLGHER